MIDWSAPAKLIERDDAGSEMSYDFHERRSGTLGDLVRAVAAMPPAERTRLVIDAGAQGTLNVAQIMVLAAREDSPR